MALYIAKDITECQELWNVFSPKQSLHDLWEFRYPFWEVFCFEPAFIVLDGEALLPLWFHPQQQQYLWFGDIGDEWNWQEDTAFWVRDPSQIAQLLAAVPGKLFLTAVQQESARHVTPPAVVTPMLPKSLLSLRGLDSVDAYLMSLPKKLRSNVRRDQRRIEALKPELSTDRLEDFLHLVRLSRATFNDSPFCDEKLQEVFLRITQCGAEACPFETHILTARIGGDVAAVDCLFLWNSTLYPLLTGSAKDRYPGIGHYMNLRDIAFALSRGMQRIDFAEVELGTVKEKLFPTVPQFTVQRT
ncbi:MAG: GNAT family N-acetyltransferase [Candidatus Peribacteraceae bacterium]